MCLRPLCASRVWLSIKTRLIAQKSVARLNRKSPRTFFTFSPISILRKEQFCGNRFCLQENYHGSREIARLWKRIFETFLHAAGGEEFIDTRRNLFSFFFNNQSLRLLRWKPKIKLWRALGVRGLSHKSNLKELGEHSWINWIEFIFIFHPACPKLTNAPLTNLNLLDSFYTSNFLYLFSDFLFCRFVVSLLIARISQESQRKTQKIA